MVKEKKSSATGIVTSSIHEIKSELKTLKPGDVADLCMRLAKYKKENKELLSYLLFDSHNEKLFVQNVRNLIDEQFGDINSVNLYLAKKTIRVALRTANKYIKYSGDKQTEAEVRIYFCRRLKGTKISIHKLAVISNLYNNQIKKIEAVISKMHEDLQYDLENELNEIKEV